MLLLKIMCKCASPITPGCTTCICILMASSVSSVPATLYLMSRQELQSFHMPTSYLIYGTAMALQLAGLDARAAAVVIRAVRNVARNNRSVMVTIHQVRQRGSRGSESSAARLVRICSGILSSVI